MAAARLCASILGELGRPDCSLTVVFAGVRLMRALNRKYRGKDYATDVLSFDYSSEGPRRGGKRGRAGRASGAVDFERVSENPRARVPGRRGQGFSDVCLDGAEGVRHLGDIVVSPSVAHSHAAEYGVAPEEEMRTLLVHGILHLLGYDHETDKGEMNRLQTRLLRSLASLRAPRILRRVPRGPQQVEE